jgi:hypothetical protein
MIPFPIMTTDQNKSDQQVTIPIIKLLCNIVLHPVEILAKLVAILANISISGSGILVR